MKDIQYKRNVVILGKDVQVDLFKNEYPLGKTVRIDGQPYQIIGLLEKKVKFLVHHSIILQLSIQHRY